MATNFTVNGKAASTDAPPATPLLWVIREGLKLTGTEGLIYDPFSDEWRLSTDTDVNYFATAAKRG